MAQIQALFIYLAFFGNMPESRHPSEFGFHKFLLGFYHTLIVSIKLYFNNNSSNNDKNNSWILFKIPGKFASWPVIDQNENIVCIDRIYVPKLYTRDD